MASNYTPSNLSSGYRSTQDLNNELDEIKQSMDRLLSREGDAPNQMETELDMNSQRIINIGAPVNNSDAIRLQDIANLDNQTSATIISIDDTAGNYTSDNVEGALAEIGTDIDSLEGNIATTAEAEAGTNDTAFMTPAKTTDHFDARTGTASADVPTNADLRDGVDRGALSTDGFGDALWAKPVITGSPGTGTAYLLLARYQESDDAISGILVGRRSKISSSAENQAHFHVSIASDPNGTNSSGWLQTSRVDNGINIQLVTLTYNTVSWVALEIVGSTFTHFDHMSFSGHAKSGSSDQFSYVDSDQVSNVTDFVSNRTPVFSGRSGDIVESGTNSNGSYVRWENGEQVCWLNGITLSRTSNSQLQATWNFPADFSSNPTVQHTNNQALPSGKRLAMTTNNGPAPSLVNLSLLNDIDSPFTAGTETATQDAFAWGFWK